METSALIGAVTNPLYRVRASVRVSNPEYAKAMGQPETEVSSHA
jgi:hypothetical protein